MGEALVRISCYLTLYIDMIYFHKADKENEIEGEHINIYFYFDEWNILIYYHPC